MLKDKNRLTALPSFLEDVNGAAAFTVLQGRGVRLPQCGMGSRLKPLGNAHTSW